jgi:hypothetical protein
MATQTQLVVCNKCGKLRPAPRAAVTPRPAPVRASATPVPAPPNIAAAIHAARGTRPTVHASAAPVSGTVPPPPDVAAAIRASRKGTER